MLFRSYSMDSFETQFFNTFLSLLPKNVSVPKEVLIKNILPAYLSKGSENSFKLLFRLLFGDEIEVKYPKNNILRASDGKWKTESLLLMSDVVQTEKYGDGTTTNYDLNQVLDLSDFQVYVDDVLKVTNTDYYHRKEQKKIIFKIAPASGSLVKIVYNSFDVSTILNRPITGVSSGASTIIEKIERSFGPYTSFFNI